MPLRAEPRHRPLLLALVVASSSLGGCRAGRAAESSVWSIAPDRGGVVFLDGGDRLVLRRPDGDRRVALGACHPRGNPSTGLLALRDARALFFSFTVHGGNWSESGSVGDRTACIVDFGDGSVRDTDALPTGDPRHFAALTGAATGWVYVLGAPDRVTLVDLAGARTTTLPVRNADRDRSAVVELADRLRVIHAELDNDPPYHGHLVVDDFDRATWPPALLDSRRLDLAGRSDRIAISDDGQWVAYDGRDFRDTGITSDLGLVELATGTVAFARTAVPGQQRLHDVVIVAGAPHVLSSTRPAGADDRAPATIAWLDRTGAPTGPSRTHADATLRWLPAFDRVLAASYGTLDLLALPPAAP